MSLSCATFERLLIVDPTQHIQQYLSINILHFEAHTWIGMMSGILTFGSLVSEWLLGRTYDILTFGVLETHGVSVTSYSGR